MAAANMVTIDGKQYDRDALSKGARDQITNVEMVDRKIAALQQELAIMQTARNAYTRGLKAELDKIKEVH